MSGPARAAKAPNERRVAQKPAQRALARSHPPAATPEAKREDISSQNKFVPSQIYHQHHPYRHHNPVIRFVQPSSQLTVHGAKLPSHSVDVALFVFLPHRRRQRRSTQVAHPPGSSAWCADCLPGCWRCRGSLQHLCLRTAPSLPGRVTGGPGLGERPAPPAT